MINEKQMPKKKFNNRKQLIQELSCEITRAIFDEKFKKLTYLDVIEALHISISDCFRWLRRSQPYRKIKESLK